MDNDKAPTLTEFVKARISEDETAAKRHQADASKHGWGDYPARVLAECEAKRGAIKAAWADHCAIEGEWGSGQSEEEMSAEDDNPAVVCFLAAVYSDHPDYRQEWKP